VPEFSATCAEGIARSIFQYAGSAMISDHSSDLELQPSLAKAAREQRISPPIEIDAPKMT
jgi:hypothetical protein